jgi:methyl-accepting chemotaxis protein
MVDSLQGGDQMAKPYKRSKFIVDNIQYRLLIIGIFYFSMVALIFAFGVFAPVIIQLEHADIRSQEMREAAHQFLVLHERVWMPLAATFALLIVHNILVSHRIAGPLYRIRAVLRSVGGGDLSGKLTLRGKDYLNKEADTVNAMIDSLRDKINRLQHHGTESMAGMTALKRSVQTGSMDVVSQHTEKLSTDIDSLVRCLDEFKMQRDTTGPRGDAGDTGSPKTTAETVGSAT